MNNYDRVLEATQKAEDSSGTAEEKYKAYTDSVAYSMAKIEQAWEKLTLRIRANDAFKIWGNSVAFLIDKLDVLLRMYANFVTLSRVGTKMQSAQFMAAGQSAGNAHGLRSMLARFSPTPGVKAAMAGSKAGLRGLSRNPSDYGYSQDKNGKWHKPGGGFASSKEIEAIENQKTWGQQYRTNLKMGAVTGVAAGIGSVLAGRGMFDDKFGVGDVKDTAADKAVRGTANAVATGLLTAIPGIGPMLGPVLGPIIGDGVGGWIKKILHSGELIRKTIVEQAEKEIKAINAASSAMNTMVELSKTENKYWSADDWKNWRDSIEKVKELAADEEGGKGFVEAFTRLYGKDPLAALDELSSSADLAAQKLADMTKAAAVLAEGEAKYNQGVEDRYQLEQAVVKAEKKREAILASLGTDYNAYVAAHTTTTRGTSYYNGAYAPTTSVYSGEYADETAWQAAYNNAGQEEVKRAKKKYTDAVLAAQKELDQSKIEAALYASGVGSMTAEEIGNATLERVVYNILQQSTEFGYDNAFIGGGASATAVKAVQQLLREHGGYENLFANANRSYGQISRRAGKLSGNYTDLYAMAMAEDDSALRKYMETTSFKDLDALRDFIFGSDPAKLERIANGFGMTKESFEALGDVVDIITEADSTNTLEKFTEKLKKMVDVFSNLSVGALTQDNINYLKEYAPELLLNEAGEADIVGLGPRLVNALTSGQLATAIGAKVFQEAQTSKTEWSAFVAKANMQGKTYNGATDAAYTTFEDVVKAGKDSEELQADFYKYIQDTSAEYDYLNKLQEDGIKLGKHYIQQEIDGLQSIKDSLGEINRQREKEIALLKARDALENAKNEKKRVYRAGLGFIYTADSEAIKEAQQNLEKLETEKQQEDIQYQIDTLKNQQSILDNIEQNKQLESLQNSFDGFIGKDGQGGKFGDLYNFLTNRTDRTQQKEEIAEGIAQGAEQMYDVLFEQEREAWENPETGLKKLYDNYQGYMDKYTELIGNDRSSATDINSALNSAKTAYQAYENAYNSHGPNSAYFESMPDADKTKYSSLIENGAPPEDAAIGEDKWYSVNFKGSAFNNGKGWARISLRTLKAVPKEVLESVKGYQMELYNPGTESFGDKQDFDDKNIPNNSIALLRDANGWYLVYKDSQGVLNYPKIQNDTHEGYTLDGGEIDAGWPNKTYVHRDSKDYVAWHAAGSYSTAGGKAFINEFGTEGIVTPYGTLTALPAKSGIVPADLTKNLFELGAVAPTLIRRMEQRDILERSGNSSEDNSMSIQNFYAKFETGDGFDFEKLLVQARQYVALSKQNRVNVK